MRAAIKEQRLPEWVRAYVARMYPRGDCPQWVVDALDVAGISLDGVAALKPAHDFERELRDGAYACLNVNAGGGDGGGGGRAQGVGGKKRGAPEDGDD
jgi:hypothetical protein